MPTTLAPDEILDRVVACIEEHLAEQPDEPAVEVYDTDVLIDAGVPWKEVTVKVISQLTRYFREKGLAVVQITQYPPRCSWLLLTRRPEVIVHEVSIREGTVDMNAALPEGYEWEFDVMMGAYVPRRIETKQPERS